MFLLFMIGIPTIAVILIFVITAKKTVKRKLKEIGVLFGTILLLFLTLSPTSLGLKWYRTVRTNYDIPNNFEVKTYNGLRRTELAGIELSQEEPIFVIDSDYRYEIYTGDYLFDGFYAKESAYQGFHAIGITVYDDDIIICKVLYPSIMNINTLELTSTEPVTLRTGTFEQYYEYVIELDKMENIVSSDEWYYSFLNEKPEREYYIPYNQGFVVRDDK